MACQLSTQGIGTRASGDAETVSRPDDEPAEYDTNGTTNSDSESTPSASGRPPLARGLAMLIRCAGKPFVGKVAQTYLEEILRYGVDLSSLLGWRSDTDDMLVLRHLQQLASVIVDPSRVKRHGEAMEAFHAEAARLSEPRVGAALIRFAEWQLAWLHGNPRLPRRLKGRERAGEAHACANRAQAFSEAYWQGYAARMRSRECLRRRVAREQSGIVQHAEPQPIWPSQPGLSDFGRHAGIVTVYLDEAWSQRGNRLGSDQVLFGGLLWLGAEPDRTELPYAPNGHMRGLPLLEAMRALNTTSRARPFVVSVTTPGLAIRAAQWYVEYLQLALAAAIGLMPGDGWNSRLRIVMEAAAFAGYPAGFDGTVRLAGYLDGLAAVFPQRFGRWRVQEAVWREKNAEYLGYADAICYLGQDTTAGAAIRQAVAFDERVSRLVISPAAFSRMMRGPDEHPEDAPSCWPAAGD